MVLVFPATKIISVQTLVVLSTKRLEVGTHQEPFTAVKKPLVAQDFVLIDYGNLCRLSVRVPHHCVLLIIHRVHLIAH